MLSKSIGTNIKQFRTQKGLSQDTLAEKLFVTRQTISNYETGKSNPDVDTLQRIAEELDVDLTWLLYGKPVSPAQKANFKATVITIAIFVALSIITFILIAFTGNLRHTSLVVMPYILVRLLLVPLCSVLLGIALLQIIDYFLGIVRPKKSVQKMGRLITLCVLGANLAIVLPYILWCLFVLIQIIIGSGSVSAYFPSIPVYEKIAFSLLAVLYKAPYVYAIAGMALWLFHLPKKDCTKSYGGDVLI